MDDDYCESFALPEIFRTFTGPKGLALVKTWPDGRTDPGWGQDSFMAHYNRGEFNERRVLYGYERNQWAFALVMRSVRLVCIDIDGKNGGLEHAKKLGVLPPTLAETSKSGNGYHLFYEVDETWDDRLGFASLSDRIGIEQGVDIRATGCVYHHNTQRWNQRVPAMLPDYLRQLLQGRDQKIEANNQRISKILDNDDITEVLMLHEEILSDLKKPIPQGKRNITLFALGNQMRQAEIPEWDQVLSDRANELGLDATETASLIRNIERYGS